MTSIVRAALTETCNAFADMPATLEDLPALSDRLDEVRRANVDHHLELVASAAEDSVRVLCFGELFTGPYFALHEHEMWFGLAEDAEHGPTVSVLREAARRHAMILVAPLYEFDAGSGKRFNTAVVIDERGEVLGKYRKTHIPSGSNETATFSETFYYGRSDGELKCSAANVSNNPFFPVFETSAGRIGVATCYDRHFDGAARSLASGGAQILFSPAVTFGAKSRRMWEFEFPVDAARQGLFIGGSNRRGAERPWNVEFFGGSYFVGPEGRLEARASRPELIVADLDLSSLERRDGSGWDLRRDARGEIYSD